MGDSHGFLSVDPGEEFRVENLTWYFQAFVIIIRSNSNSKRGLLYLTCESSSGAERNREALLKILGKHFDVTLKE
jgi:hypothetical protein